MRHLEHLMAIDEDFDLDVYDQYLTSLGLYNSSMFTAPAAWWQLFDIPPDVMRDGVQARLRYLREQFDATAEPLM